MGEKEPSMPPYPSCVKPPPPPDAKKLAQDLEKTRSQLNRVLRINKMLAEALIEREKEIRRD